MFTRRLLIVITLLAAVTLACSININLPESQAKVGETVTQQISVALPEDEKVTTDVFLAFGAGSLHLEPGAETALITGTATYNVADFRPLVSVEDHSVRVEQGNLKLDSLPNFGGNVRNEWELQLGTAPMNLTINAGAYTGNLSFGGLALENLEISDGAADVNLSFDEPNLVDMDTLKYSTGASTVDVVGLANTRAANIIFGSGAGTYTLDFSGELTRDMSVRIESGVSTLTIIVPEGVSAQVVKDGGLSNVNPSRGWAVSGDTYLHPGEGFLITINIDIGAGTLSLLTK